MCICTKRAQRVILLDAYNLQVNFLYEKLLVIDEQSFAKKILILCLICFIYTSLQSFLRIRTMAINIEFIDNKNLKKKVYKNKRNKTICK